MNRLTALLAFGALISPPARAIAAAPEKPLPAVRYVPPTLDPAKAALARSVAARLVPAGSTAQSLQAPFNMEVMNLVHSYLMMPVERFAAEHGAELPEEGKNGPPVVRLRLLEILDPANQERMRMSSPIIQKMAADAAASKEPQLREALAIAYGQRLSVSELRAVDHFLSTPEGIAFARTSAMIENDLGVFAARQLMALAVIDAIPAMTQRLTEVTASLPKIKDTADLSDGERKEVATLLKVDVSQLSK